jgi:hypothetical protein
VCLNNAWHSCVNNTNPWNNKFHMDLERTHKVYKFVMYEVLSLCYNYILKPHVLNKFAYFHQNQANPSQHVN